MFLFEERHLLLRRGAHPKLDLVLSSKNRDTHIEEQALVCQDGVVHELQT